jgi:uncharacterized protein YecT (DUF1311 family)
MRFTLFCISLLFSIVAAAAAEHDGAPQCNYDGNQREMNACAVLDYKAADNILNQKYKEVMSSLPPPKQERLRQQQRAWLQKRDLQCKAEARPSEGGSIWPLEFYGCLKTVTQGRTKELAKIPRRRDTRGYDPSAPPLHTAARGRGGEHGRFI